MIDCKNCKHYKHTRKICRLEKLGQACNYEPFEKIEIPPNPATKRAEVKSRW